MLSTHKALPQLLRETAFSYLKAKEIVMGTWQPDCECDQPFPCERCPLLSIFTAKVKDCRQQLWEQQVEVEQRIAS